MRAPRSSHAPSPGRVLLYDGLCGFCNRTVRFILARDPGGSMRFATLQGEFAEALFARHPTLRSVDSLILVERAGVDGLERARVRSEAVVQIGRYLGGVWRRAASLLRVIPRPLRDWLYDVFARHRSHLFGRYDSCPVPDPALRARFID